MAGGNLPSDDVTGLVLSNLGVARFMIGDSAFISPIAILGVRSILIMLPGMFWKNIEKRFKLS
jgi:hypothetical protein